MFGLHFRASFPYLKHYCVGVKYKELSMENIRQKGWRHPGMRSDNYGRSSINDHDRRTYAGIGPKGYSRNDESIKEEVCEILIWSPDVDAREIDVFVKDGIVRLEGFVDSRYSKKQSESLLEEVSGIVDIENQLIIKKKLDIDSDKIITRGDDGLYSEETIPR